LTYYAFLLGMGAVISQLRLARVVPLVERNAWLAAGMGILLAALAGARLDYCLERFSYYGHRPLEVAAFWQGGLAWQGAVIGGWAAVIFLSFAWQKPLAVLLDFTSVMLLPMAVTVWLGAWTEGAAYGAALPAGTWWGMPSMDVSGEAALRVPLQLGASLLLLVGIGAVEVFSPRIKRSGIQGALTWLVFSLAMIPFTLLRDDPSPLLLNLRVETWFAILFAAVSFFLFLEMLRVSKFKTTNPKPVPLDDIKEGQ